MAKRRYRRYRRRRSGRWSSNISTIRDQLANVPSGDGGSWITLAQNPVQTLSSVSQNFTVKNIEIAAQLEVSTTGNPHNIENIEYYIMYLPEGYPQELDLPNRHPEWIMAYKYIGTGIGAAALTTSNAQVPRIRTRLARKLNTGDSIIFLYRFINANSSDTPTVKINGLVRWWTKAN